MKILRDRGPSFIFLLFVLCFGAEWDRWNDAPTIEVNQGVTK